MREKFDPAGEARARAREVAVGVHGEDATVADGWEILPAWRNFCGLEFGGISICVIAAEHYQNYICIALRYVLF